MLVRGSSVTALSGAGQPARNRTSAPEWRIYHLNSTQHLLLLRTRRCFLSTQSPTSQGNLEGENQAGAQALRPNLHQEICFPAVAINLWLMAESWGSYTVGAVSAKGIQWKAIKREELPLYHHCEKTDCTCTLPLVASQKRERWCTLVIKRAPPDHRRKTLVVNVLLWASWFCFGCVVVDLFFF